MSGNENPAPEQRTDNISSPGQSPASSAIRPVIAIDGPAGAGKSTLAAHLARRFGFLNLETGAMYRALALKAIEGDLDLDEEAPLLALARSTTIRLEQQRDGNRVLLDRFDVSHRIRDADVSSAASRVSVHPALRAWMVEQQRILGAHGGVVMEGRDIGTCVFPHAAVKIFLDAAPEVRGNRRFRQVTPGASSSAGGSDASFTRSDAILKELKERDRRDRERKDSPLRPAEDAVIIDSTSLTLDQVLTRAEQIVRERLEASPTA